MTTPEAGAVVGGHSLAPEVVTSLRQAADKTGVPFDFLVAQASLESGFHGSAHAAHSSASGLFQFTTSTWLDMMRRHGARCGYGDLAHHIKAHADGHLTVSDRATEKRILDLRKDVQLSALFAAEYAKENAKAIEHATGHKASAADLHLAHLLGPTGAIRFLKAHAHDGRQSAASIVPAAARQNPTLFYGRGSRTPESVAAVYRKIEQSLAKPLKQAEAIDRPPLRPALGLMTDAAAPPTPPRTDRKV